MKKMGRSMVYIDLYPIYRTIFGLSIETGMIYGLKGIYLCLIYDFYLWFIYRNWDYLWFILIYTMIIYSY